jgi:hypothetical protein
MFGASSFRGALLREPGIHNQDIVWIPGPRQVAHPGMTVAYASNTASAPFTASALSITVRSSDPACTEIFSAKNRASVT